MRFARLVNVVEVSRLDFPAHYLTGAWCENTHDAIVHDPHKMDLLFKRAFNLRGIMQIDWITWGLWAFGLTLLLYWCLETLREFKSLFSSHKKKRGEPHN